MANKQVTVLARFNAKNGMEERLKKELMSMLAPTRAQAGCINYDLHQAADNKRLFILYENWESKDALEQHMQTTHFKNLKAVSNEILTEPFEVTLLEILSNHSET